MGRKLLLRVGDVMVSGSEVPRVCVDDLMRSVILEITGKKLGMTAVVGRDGSLCGVITDGDLRRALQEPDDLLERAAEGQTALNGAPSSLVGTS